MHLQLFPIKYPTIDYAPSKQPGRDHLWLLGFLKNHIFSAQLSFFATSLIPVIEKLQKNRAKSKKENRLYEAKVLDNITGQVWELWPAFAKHAIDIEKGFHLVGMPSRSSINVTRSYVFRSEIHVLDSD